MHEQKFMTIKYYYLAMTQKNMLQNQVLEEILRERAHNYFLRKKPLDFWILIAPDFLTNKETQQTISATNFFLQKNSELISAYGSTFYSCIISLDMDFLRWVQLRLGSFENPLFCNKALTESNSDGIFGQVCLDRISHMGIAGSKLGVLQNKPNQLYPLLCNFT